MNISQVAQDILDTIVIKNDVDTWRQAVSKLMDVSHGKALHEFIDLYRKIKTLDWYYYYSDSADVYRRGEETFKRLWAELDQQSSMYQFVFGLVACEMATKAIFVSELQVTWGSTEENYHVEFEGKIIMIPVGECVVVNDRRYCILPHGEVVELKMPCITLTMVKEAAENGLPVTAWRNFELVRRYHQSEIFYGWVLNVCIFNPTTKHGSVIALPNNTNSRAIYRAGKIKHFAELTGKDLAWASRYYQFARRVKYSMEANVVRATAELTDMSLSEFMQQSPASPRVESAILMANLMLNRINAKEYFAVNKKTAKA